MNRKLLQGLGVVFVLGLIGASIAALSLSAQRVHVTISPADAAVGRGPDPQALLAADIAELRTDVRATNEALAPALEALHASLEQAAAERARSADSNAAERERKLEARLASLERALASTRDELARVQFTASAMNGTSSTTPSASVAAQARDAASEPAPSNATPPPNDARVIEPAPVTAAPVPVDPVNEVPGEARAPQEDGKKSFLAFRVPKSGSSAVGAFAGRQRWSILPSLSRVGFDAKSTLHDFSGVTSSVDGEIVVDLAQPAAGCSGSVSATGATLDTGVADRDEEMRKRLAVDANPKLRFDWTSFEPREVDATGEKLTGEARGKLTIKGVAREVRVPVRANVDKNRRLTVEGELKIKMSEFGIEPPNQLGMIKVQDEVTVWIALRARSLGAATEKAAEGGTRVGALDR